jgi:acyl carrier protein
MELRNIDTDDIEYLLLKIESSFDMKFGDTELAHVTTFGELCDIIANKIELENTYDCTTQQAFYKLRAAVTEIFQTDKKTISTDMLLSDLLPRINRKTKVKQLENQLGYKLNILRPPHWVTSTLILIFITALVGLFVKFEIGFILFVISVIGLWSSKKLGNELDVKTLGQLAEKMTRENYLKVRRNPLTYNKTEIEKIITDLFADFYSLDKSKLKRDATFV